MILLRSRHRELDKFRTIDPRYNVAWVMFFGTKPPGLNPAGVRFSEAEAEALADNLPIPAGRSGFVEVEPYDPRVRNNRGLGKMHGSC